jgi:hypothetical protein
MKKRQKQQLYLGQQNPVHCHFLQVEKIKTKKDVTITVFKCKLPLIEDCIYRKHSFCQE